MHGMAREKKKRQFKLLFQWMFSLVSFGISLKGSFILGS